MSETFQFTREGGKTVSLVFPVASDQTYTFPDTGSTITFFYIAQVQSDWNAVSGLGVVLNKPSLFDGTWGSLLGKPPLFDGTWTSLSGKPSLATVATSGAYDDLSGKPTIPAAQVQSDWNASSGLGAILNKPTLFDGTYSSLSGKPTLFDGTYGALTGKPTLGTAAAHDVGYFDLAGAAAAVTPTTLGLVIGTNVQAYNAKLGTFSALADAAGWLHSNGGGTYAWSTPTYSDVGADAAGAAAARQAVLVSGTNIKTINSNSLLGSGDLAITGGGSPAMSAYYALTY